jgi:hypothetical protein
MSPLEPQSAANYDDRSTEAVKSVLLEIGQILGSYKGKFVVVGGLTFGRGLSCPRSKRDGSRLTSTASSATIAMASLPWPTPVNL